MLVVCVWVGGGVLTKQLRNLLPQIATVRHCVNPRAMKGLIAQAIKMNIITNLAPLTPDQNTDSSTHRRPRTHVHTHTHATEGCLGEMLTRINRGRKWQILWQHIMISRFSRSLEGRRLCFYCSTHSFATVCSFRSGTLGTCTQTGPRVHNEEMRDQILLRSTAMRRVLN